MGSAAELGARRRMSEMGHSRQVGDSGMSAYARYSLKAEVNSEH
jgi:hypothetical protein